MPMPQFIRPMQATLINQPFNHKDWLFEVKWDGYRIIAKKEGDEVHLLTRNGNSMNRKFSEVVTELEKIDAVFILDGEMIVLDTQGKPSFNSIQHYPASGGFLVYNVFDILYLNGKDVTCLPLLKRKEIAKKLIDGLNSIKYSDHILENGKVFFSAIKAQDLEGMIAKEINSVYEEGQKSRKWFKIKNIKEQEAVIGGYTKPSGGQKYFGALLLGVYENGKFIFIGKVGTGFADTDLAEIVKLVSELEISKSPFENFNDKTSNWVNPELVCQVKFTEWTKDQILRQPVFLGLRQDKNAQQVVREKEVSVKEVLDG